MNLAVRIPQLLIVSAALLSGCARRSASIDAPGPGAGSGAFAPSAPAFLLSPASRLLTNSVGFSARVSGTEVSWPLSNYITGQLLGLGPQLLFAPDPAKHRSKIANSGFLFLWNVETRQGYLMSEALQGYAPMSRRGSATNVVITLVAAPPETISGHQAQPEHDVFAMDDGSNAHFEVWRSAELNQLPIRIISSSSNASPFTLTLSKIRLETLSTNLFAPPAGFTPYTSPEAMMSELIMRQHNLKRGGSVETIESYPYRPRR